MMHHCNALQSRSQRTQHLQRPQRIHRPPAGIPHHARDALRLDGPEVLWVGARVDAGDYDADGVGADGGEAEFGGEGLGDGAGGRGEQRLV